MPVRMREKNDLWLILNKLNPTLICRLYQRESTGTPTGVLVYTLNFWGWQITSEHHAQQVILARVSERREISVL